MLSGARSQQWVGGVRIFGVFLAGSTLQHHLEVIIIIVF